MDEVKICEKCCSEIGPKEAHVRYAHVIDTQRDGTPIFSYAYVHHPKVVGCVAEAPADAA